MAPGPVLAAQIAGSGPDPVLRHGGRGSRNHWVRNVDALAPHFQWLLRPRFLG